VRARESSPSGPLSIGAPVRRYAGTPVRWYAGTLVRRYAGTPVRRYAGTPVRSSAYTVLLLFTIPFSSNATCAAASRAIGTRNGEQET